MCSIKIPKSSASNFFLNLVSIIERVSVFVDCGPDKSNLNNPG